MKRRNFLKGLFAAPFLFTAIKTIEAEPLKEKSKEIDIINSYGGKGGGGYLESKEGEKAILRTISKNKMLYKRLLK